MDLLKDHQFLLNSFKEWSLAVAVTLLVYFTLLLVKAYVRRRKNRALDLKKPESLLLLLAPAINKTYKIFLFIFSLYLGSLFLETTPQIRHLLQKAAIFTLLAQVVIWAFSLINHYAHEYAQKKMSEDITSVTAVNFITFLAKMAILVLTLLLVLDQFGVNITTLVAGLGVGGIAVALAVQNILGDLFASLTIILDRPFEVGDFIIIGEQLGTVEKVGLKTARIQSLWGEQLVFSNNDLLQSRIRNFKRMRERRVLFHFGVLYETPYEKLKNIPALVEKIINEQENTRFDRAHFYKYGDSSLDFEVVYYTLNPDYNFYMDTQQAINLSLFKNFQDMDIGFAYPTRTIYMQQKS